MSSRIDQLVKMANQIALNCGERRDPEMAAQKTAEHLQKFWTRDMLEQLAQHAAAGGDDVSPAVHIAIAQSQGVEQ